MGGMVKIELYRVVRGLRAGQVILGFPRKPHAASDPSTKRIQEYRGAQLKNEMKDDNGAFHSKVGVAIGFSTPAPEVDSWDPADVRPVYPVE